MAGRPDLTWCLLARRGHGSGPAAGPAGSQAGRQVTVSVTGPPQPTAEVQTGTRHEVHEIRSRVVFFYFSNDGRYNSRPPLQSPTSVATADGEWPEPPQVCSLRCAAADWSPERHTVTSSINGDVTHLALWGGGE